MIELAYVETMEFKTNITPGEDNNGTLGSSSKKWNTVYAQSYNTLLVGLGTVANINGDTHHPVKWTYATGLSLADGMIINIRVPCNGHEHGVFISINNGGSYKPIVTEGTKVLTTQFNNAISLQLIYESSGVATDVYNLEGSTSKGTVSGGVWRVLNYYDPKYPVTTVTENSTGVTISVANGDSIENHHIRSFTNADKQSIVNTVKNDLYEKSEIDSMIETLGILSSENRFKSSAFLRHFEHGFDYLCIETFEDCNDIDDTLEDGATVISQYWVEESHVIKKTGEGSSTIISKKFHVDDIPYYALILADWDGSGSVSLSISKNDGEDWYAITNDTLVHLNGLVQKDIRVKIEMTGQVRLKNIAWGIK